MLQQPAWHGPSPHVPGACWRACRSPPLPPNSRPCSAPQPRWLISSRQRQRAWSRSASSPCWSMECGCLLEPTRVDDDDDDHACMGPRPIHPPFCTLQVEVLQNPTLSGFKEAVARVKPNLVYCCGPLSFATNKHSGSIGAFQFSGACSVLISPRGCPGVEQKPPMRQRATRMPACHSFSVFGRPPLPAFSWVVCLLLQVRPRARTAFWRRSRRLVQTLSTWTHPSPAALVSTWTGKGMAATCIALQVCSWRSPPRDGWVTPWGGG